MRSFHIEEHRLFVADDIYRLTASYSRHPVQDNVEEFKSFTWYTFLRRPLLRTLVARFGVVHRLQGYALLHAHGGTRQGQWTFCDGRRVVPVQQWVDMFDGQYCVLLLMVCNHRRCRLRSDHSIIIHANRAFSVSDGSRGQARLRVFVPGFGYGADSTRIRRIIDRLR